jgi:hypothetical protein
MSRQLPGSMTPKRGCWPWGENALGGRRYDRILALAGMACPLLLSAPPDALAQEASKPNATFNERFPAEQTPTQSVPQPAPQTTPRTAVTKREHNVETDAPQI